MSDQTVTTDTGAVLATLRDNLRTRDVDVYGPYPGCRHPWHPEPYYLKLDDGQHVHAHIDGNGFWQALIFDGGSLARMADVDGRDWPGDSAA